jgi:hypothetical protein
VLFASGAVDSHYVLIPPATCAAATVPLNCSETGSTSDGFGPSTYVVMGPNGTYPLNGVAWVMPNDNGSQWIGPRADQTNPTIGGTTFPNVDLFANTTEFYVYRLTFNLTAMGLDPATAVIQLQWISDNNQNQFPTPTQNSHIRLCSISSISDPVCASSTMIASSGNPGQASGTMSGTITITGVGAGLQALDFIVYNSVLAFGQNPTGMRVNIISATANDVIPEPSTLVLVSIGLVLGILSRRKQ